MRKLLIGFGFSVLVGCSGTVVTGPSAPASTGSSEVTNGFTGGTSGSPTCLVAPCCTKVGCPPRDDSGTKPAIYTMPKTDELSPEEQRIEEQMEQELEAVRAQVYGTH